MFSNNECQIPFLDCRGFYDLASQIIGLIITILILYRSLANYRQLKQQKSKENDTEYQHGLRRKIMINFLNIVFLSVLIGHVLFSMVLFQIVSEEKIQNITDNQLQKWYKSTQMLFVQFLNGLLLTVGLLYWHGLHFFFRIKQINPPFPFGKIGKYSLCLCGMYCVITFVIGMVFVFMDNDNDLFLVNLLILISSAISMMLFIFFKISYYKNIFRSVRLGNKIVTRERVYNALIIFSSLARMVLCILDMNSISIASLRSYTYDCFDMQPIHAVVLLSITIGVDLLPSFVFSRIFTTLQRQRHLHQTDIDQTLFSAQPSQIVSGETQ